MLLTPFRVEPKAFHELIVMPQFGDVLDAETGSVTVPSDEEGDWQIMDDVTYQRPVMDLFGGQNVLKRKDATCKLIYSPAARLGVRYITTEKLYAATEDCQDEFYQGSFQDYEQENFDIFAEKVLPILEKGVATDIYCNKYFGDISRASDTSGIWSWNKFGGVFGWYAKYIADGTIPSGQTFAIAAGDLTPQQCHDYIAAAYAKQDYILKNFDADLKAIYVDRAIADGYADWLAMAGLITIEQKMGISAVNLKYKQIEVRVKKWDGPLAALNGGTAAHAVILTLKGNWIYGADSKYGGGPKRNEAVRVWWNDEDNVWKRQIHLKAGTQIAAPQHTVIGLTAF